MLKRQVGRESRLELRRTISIIGIADFLSRCALLSWRRLRRICGTCGRDNREKESCSSCCPRFGVGTSIFADHGGPCDGDTTCRRCCECECVEHSPEAFTETTHGPWQGLAGRQAGHLSLVRGLPSSAVVVRLRATQPQPDLRLTSQGRRWMLYLRGLNVRLVSPTDLRFSARGCDAAR